VLMKVAFYKGVKFINQLIDCQLSKIDSGVCRITEGKREDYFQTET
jgi:hypothetical protein